jgi:iron complex transport system substrate-binding protein
MTSREIDAAAGDGHRGASLFHVDPDRLRLVQPQLILTQEVCGVCAVSRRDVDLAAQTLGYRPIILSLNPVTLDQVLEDVETVARAAGVPPRGSTCAAELRARLQAVRATVAGQDRPRVLCMEWLDPLYTAGHWVPGMVDLAGGRDDLGQSGALARRIGWDDGLEYQPEVVVLIPCSLKLDRVASEFSLVHQRPSWFELPAARSGRVYAADTGLFSCSGPRLVDGVEVLARLLHPEMVPARLAQGRAMKVSDDGRRLEPYQ